REWLGLGREVAGELDGAGGVEDADVERPCVQVHAHVRCGRLGQESHTELKTPGVRETGTFNSIPAPHLTRPARPLPGLRRPRGGPVTPSAPGRATRPSTGRPPSRPRRPAPRGAARPSGRCAPPAPTRRRPA